MDFMLKVSVKLTRSLFLRVQFCFKKVPVSRSFWSQRTELEQKKNRPKLRLSRKMKYTRDLLTIDKKHKKPYKTCYPKQPSDGFNEDLAIACCIEDDKPLKEV